jgi:hypothetical protein
MRLEPLEQLPLHVEPLDDRLDDPVRRRRAREAVVEPSGRDERVCIRGEERIRLERARP